jgi:hypothetical protein
VFVKAPSEAAVDVPFSATVAVEDQFGNVDTGVNNVPVTLVAVPGNSSTAEIKRGVATLNDAFFIVAGEDTLLAVTSPPIGASLVGSDAIVVVG